MFVDIANQLAEIEGSDLIEKSDKAILENENKPKENLASSLQEEFLEAYLADEDGKQGLIKINFRGIEQLVLKFYKIDLEVLFSKSPFLTNIGKSFSYVSPYMELRNPTAKIVENSEEEFHNTTVKLPEKLLNENLYVQVCGHSKNVTFPYFPTSLKIRVSENYGIVKIYDETSRKPISRVYVKCFYRNKETQEVAFYKDGYTDLRGSFDYVRINRDIIEEVDRFALLIVGPEGKGLVVKECGRPSLVGSFDGMGLIDQEMKQLQHKMMNEL